MILLSLLLMPILADNEGEYSMMVNEITDWRRDSDYQAN
jgi:hypothetical protein